MRIPDECPDEIRPDARWDQDAPCLAIDQEAPSSDGATASDTESRDDSMPAYEPSSPMSALHLASCALKSDDEDIQPAMRLVSQDAKLTETILDINEEIMQLVAQLRGVPSSYRRERVQVIQTLVSEICSAPHITQALKKLPNINRVPDVAFDLSGHDEAGGSWA